MLNMKKIKLKLRKLILTGNIINNAISAVYNLKAALFKKPTLNTKKGMAICITLVLALTAGLTLTARYLPGQKDQSQKNRTISAGAAPAARSDGGGSGGNLASRDGMAREDVYLMARVIEGEAAAEPFEGKVAVGAVIMNRIESDRFPDSLRQVVYQPMAFEAVANGQFAGPVSKESLKAARQAMAGADPTGGAVYYWNPAKAKSDWIWQRPVTRTIGRHVFAM